MRKENIIFVVSPGYVRGMQPCGYVTTNHPWILIKTNVISDRAIAIRETE
jgi:hypothetical protein